MVRNRCYNRRTGQTPYQLLTGKKANLAKMQKFGSMCYTYKQDKGKLDSRCEEGRFVGFDKNSPAYLVYHPDINKVQKHRLVKFVTKAAVQEQTETHNPGLEYDYDHSSQREITEPTQEADASAADTRGPTGLSRGTPRVRPDVEMSSDHDRAQHRVASSDSESRRYPDRTRKKPVYLEDFVDDTDSDEVHVTVDYCYRALCGK